MGRLEEVLSVCQFPLSAIKDTPAHAFASRSCRPVDRLLYHGFSGLMLDVWRENVEWGAGGRVEDGGTKPSPQATNAPAEALLRCSLTSRMTGASCVYTARDCNSSLVFAFHCIWAVSFGEVPEG